MIHVQPLPMTAVCKHCAQPIGREGRVWVHAHGQYKCYPSSFADPADVSIPTKPDEKHTQCSCGDSRRRNVSHCKRIECWTYINNIRVNIDTNGQAVYPPT